VAGVLGTIGLSAFTVLHPAELAGVAVPSPSPALASLGT
jgi:hypothetical protein